MTLQIDKMSSFLPSTTDDSINANKLINQNPKSHNVSCKAL